MKTIKFKLPTLGIKDRDYAALPFGRRIEYAKAIQAFKATAKQTHLSQKRQSYAKAIAEFCKLNNVTEYYCEFFNTADCKDDSFQFFYLTS